MLFIIFIILAIIAYYAGPIAFLINPALFTPYIYLNNVREPYLVKNLSDFPSVGLSEFGCRNFYIQSDYDGTKLGVWQILPNQQSINEKKSEQGFKDALADKNPIFIYLHGVAYDRGASFRVGVYKRLSQMGYHVFALDYRGFGDSEGTPLHEEDVDGDVSTLINYVQPLAPDSTVILWGHSMGTGISGSTYKRLYKSQKEYIKGILLDAPYDAFSTVVGGFAIAQPFKAIIAIKEILNQVLSNARIYFTTSKNLAGSGLPITIMHSEDDDQIPFAIGENLYKVLLESRARVTFEDLGRHGYGHNFNYKSPRITTIILALVTNANTASKGTS